MEMPDKTREMVLRGGALFIRREIALTLSKAWRFWCLFLRACRHGNIWPNLTEMCVHAGLFAAKMFGHTRRSLFFICSPSKIVAGHPARQRRAHIRQAQANRRTLLPSNWQTYARKHTHTPAYTHTLSQQWEVVLKLWQTVQPAEAIHGELFCSIVWCCFSN